MRVVMYASLLSLAFAISLLASGMSTASVAISFPPYLDNLSLKEGQENTFRITVINYYPQPLAVTISDNCDNRTVVVSYPSAILVENGSPNEGAVGQVEVKVKAKAPGTFWFSLDVICALAGEAENVENITVATIVGTFGVNFRGEVREKGLSLQLVAAIIVAILIILVAVSIAVVKTRRMTT